MTLRVTNFENLSKCIGIQKPNNVSFFLLHFETTQIKNENDVRDISIEQRNCRFPDERWPLHASLPYSIASCMTYTQIQIELDLCNCTLHFAPIECNHFRVMRRNTKLIAHFNFIQQTQTSIVITHRWNALKNTTLKV